MGVNGASDGACGHAAQLMPQMAGVGGVVMGGSPSIAPLPTDLAGGGGGGVPLAIGHAQSLAASLPMAAGMVVGVWGGGQMPQLMAQMGPPPRTA